LILASGLAIGCGKSSDDSAADDSAGSTATAGVGGGISKSGSVNALADAFPVSLALAAFPKADDAAGLRLDDSSEVEDPNAGKNLAEKVAENKEIVEGKADRCLNPDVFRPHFAKGDVTCYEFDSDMNPSRFAGSDREFGTVDGTDGAGEACMVTFVREQVREGVETVDQALALVGGMICQAKKDGVATGMPDKGSELDLAASMETATNGHMTVTTAKIARLDDIDEKPVYRSDIVVTDGMGRDLEVHLVHSPGEGDNGDGTLWFIRSGGKPAAKLVGPANPPPGDGPAVDPNNSENKNHVMSIQYSRTETDGVPNMRFESTRAAIVDTIDPVDDAGHVNFADVPEDAQNSTIHAINHVAFDGNTDTNEGTLSYWMNPGGNYNESARGFLFNTAVDSESGELGGCGISGATASISIRKAVTEPSDENTLKPVRYWHPRENQNIHPDKDSRYSSNEGNAITQQCFKQDADGAYAIDTAITTSERGYDVIETAESNVEPPKPVEQKLEGEFLPPPVE
jgi:hypothetical protein